MVAVGLVEIPIVLHVVALTRVSLPSTPPCSPFAPVDGHPRPHPPRHVVPVSRRLSLGLPMGPGSVVPELQPPPVNPVHCVGLN